ncbi:MAG: hypothetical protein JXR86_16050 [Spirochaetales bacterium]|nr:hypothetical protein [Spirochaetales bacterium]
MTQEEYSVTMAKVYRDLDTLPEHSHQAIRIAAEQLSGMTADLGLGRLEIDASSLTKSEVKKMLREMETLDFEDLEKTVNIEKPFDGSMKQDAWSRYAIANRAELLLKQFTLLSRLRSDDPLAWDEMNELFYDD